MNNSENSQNHPLRVFEAHPHGGFPSAQVSTLLARPGVGKTAALINFALDQMLNGKPVFHFSLGSNSDKIHQFYRQIFSVFSQKYAAESTLEWNELSQNLVVLSYQNARKMMDMLEKDVDTLSTHAKMSPGLVLVDDLEFGDHLNDDLKGLSNLAQLKQTPIVVSVRIYRLEDGTLNLNPPLEIARRHASQVFFLDPAGLKIKLERLNDPDQPKTLPIHFNPQDHLFYCN